MSAGGMLTVRTRKADTGNGVEIRIGDNGIGISGEEDGAYL